MLLCSKLDFHCTLYLALVVQVDLGLQVLQAIHPGQENQGIQQVQAVQKILFDE